MKALILAGGVGTRLRPLSCTRPKLLFPILNKPLLDWTLERLARTEVDEVILAIKYMAEAFIQRYGKSKHGIKISYSLENRPMHTGGAIKYAQNLIGTEDVFLVLNGDIFTTIDYATLLKKHKQNNAVATIALYRVKNPSRYGTVKLTTQNRITQFTEKAPIRKAPSNLVNAGIYVLEPEIFNYIPSGRPASIEREVFPKLAAEEKLFGHKFKQIWIDIGKPADYLKANKLLIEAEPKKRLLGRDTNMGDGTELLEPIMVEAGVTVGQNTKLGPNTIIGRDTMLGSNIILENSVVFPKATILDHASVRGAIIGEGATIGKGATIMKGCVIGDYVTIEDNITLHRNVTICHSKEIREDVLESTHII